MISNIPGGIIETHKRIIDAGEEHYIIDRRIENKVLPYVIVYKSAPFESVRIGGRVRFASVEEAKSSLESYLDALDSIKRG